jgi:ERCC4-type nuclease
MSASKTTKYDEIVKDSEALIEFFRTANLGKKLGLHRHLTKLQDEEVKLGEALTIIDLFDVQQKLAESIVEEMVGRHLRVDHREHWTMLGYLGDLGFEIVHLDTGTGDVASTRVSIERKEDDLVPSLFDGRRLRQLGAMREEAEFSFLVVTKSYSQIKAALAERDICDTIFISFIASLCAVGYPPIFIDDRHDGSALMGKIIGKIEDDKHRLYIPRPRGAKPSDYRNALIEALPKVGLKTRRKLVERFGSIHNLSQASAEELASIEGIGNTTAKRIFDSLHE